VIRGLLLLLLLLSGMSALLHPLHPVWYQAAGHADSSAHSDSITKSSFG
jgi:hypothetical protein